jgi:predicted dienelactone hydrolase
MKALRLIEVCLLFCSLQAHGQPADNTFYSIPPVDAPELAAQGKYSVGVRTVELKNPGQVDILNFDKATGKAPTYDRPLTVEVWYPAIIPPGQQELTTYSMGMPGSEAKTVSINGKALRDAPAAKERFPLVIVSHGYPGSRFFLTYLTENLASKGYVVAAIDHTDSVFGAIKGFPSTLLNRASDQQFAISTLEDLSRKPESFLNGLLDETRVAIVGYSMGGYGALTSAGAGYNKKALTVSLVPGSALDNWLADSPKYRPRLHKEVQAVVAIAPWGAQPPFNAWDADGLAGIHIPLLMIAGDQDDVSDYSLGIKPAFEKAIHSERCMLVYENARHNVGGNPAPDSASSFTARESFEEPVWRKDRITAINQHFITAFLDFYLKEDASRAAYLHPVPGKSNEGIWPLAQGESAGAKFSEGNNYWKGFQRRWAVGLEMHCLPAAN